MPSELEGDTNTAEATWLPLEAGSPGTGSSAGAGATCQALAVWVELCVGTDPEFSLRKGEFVAASPVVPAYGGHWF